MTPIRPSRNWRRCCGILTSTPGVRTNCRLPAQPRPWQRATSIAGFRTRPRRPQRRRMVSARDRTYGQQRPRSSLPVRLSRRHLLPRDSWLLRARRAPLRRNRHALTTQHHPRGSSRAPRAGGHCPGSPEAARKRRLILKRCVTAMVFLRCMPRPACLAPFRALTVFTPPSAEPRHHSCRSWPMGRAG